MANVLFQQEKSDRNQTYVTLIGVRDADGNLEDFLLETVGPDFGQYFEGWAEAVTGSRLSALVPEVLTDTPMLQVAEKTLRDNRLRSVRLYLPNQEVWLKVTLFALHDNTLLALLEEQTVLERFHALFQNNPTIMAVMAYPDMTFVEINDAVTHRLGYQPQDLLGKQAGDLKLFEYIGQSNAEAFQHPFQAGLTQSLEGIVFSKSGERIHAQLDSELISVDGQQLCLTSMTEITSLSEMQDHLQHIVELEQLMLEQSAAFLSPDEENPSVFLGKTIDLLGQHLEAQRAFICRIDKRNGIVKVTSEWCAENLSSLHTVLPEIRLDAYPDWLRNLIFMEEIAVRDIGEYLETHPEYRAPMEALGLQSLLIVPIRGRDGRVLGSVGFDARQSSPLWKEDARRLMRFFANNIGSAWTSEQAHTELLEAVRVAEKMTQKAEQANQEKTKIMTMLSHDIRSPMNAVIGVTSMLLETELSEDQRRYAEIIQAGGQNLLRVINNVLDFSRMESGRIRILHVPFSLKDVFDEMEKIYRYPAQEKSVEMVYSLEHSVPMNLVGDATRVHQILNNLVSNAVKFTDKGTIAVRADVLEEEEARVWLELSVADQGIGIAAQDRERLFEPFWQAEGAASNRQHGTGLGLAICRRLVEEMGGAIAVRDNKPKGTVFTVRLPFDRSGETVSDAIDLEGNQPKFKNTRVLIADDMEINQEITRAFLSRIGIESDVAANGLEVLDRMRTQTYDAILMDVQMPQMDGLEASRAIRTLPDSEAASVPILALTAHALSEDLEQCMAAGMNGQIIKPIYADQLYAVLEEWIPHKLEQAVPTVKSPDTGVRSLAGAQPTFRPETGRALFAGDENRYAVMLRKYVAEYESMEDDLLALIQAGKRTEGADYLHRQVALTGLFGCPTLTESIRLLEQHLRSEPVGADAEAEEIQSVIQLHASIFKGVTDYLSGLDPEDDSTPESGDIESLCDLLQDIRNRIDGEDLTEGINILHTVRDKQWPLFVTSRLDRIMQHLEAGRTERAKKAIQAFIRFMTTQE